MIIIDKQLEQLEKTGKPIRVGLVGAGFMAQGVAFQIVNETPGMKLVAIANRTLRNAKKAYQEAGVRNFKNIKSVKELDSNISKSEYSVTTDIKILCQSRKIDVILDVTGAVEFGAKVALEAIKNKKHLVSMNAELDGTVGPILKKKAKAAGVIYTLADGDQPGVIMNLYRYVCAIGLKPVLCGNIKGLHDPSRNPTTQAGFAKKWKQRPEMVTSFADGTKISFEQVIVANATGMKVGKRGMFGPQVPLGTSISDIAKYYPAKSLNSKEGIVDYVVGATPAPGIFVIAKLKSKKQKHYLNYYKLGEGPFYVLYAPYHICHFDVPSSIARAVIFGDETISPLNGPVCDVITVAKKNLKKGEIIDGLGGYCTYGLAENHSVTVKQNLLPIGLAEGCLINKNIKKDQAITYLDIDLPKGRLINKLWKEQLELFKK